MTGDRPCIRESLPAGRMSDPVCPCRACQAEAWKALDKYATDTSEPLSVDYERAAWLIRKVMAEDE